MRIFVITILVYFSQSLFTERIFLVPGKYWGFKFDSAKHVHQKGNASSTEYQFEAESEDGFIISGFIEPASGKGNDSTSCMKYYWALSSKNPGTIKDTVKVVVMNPFAVVVYLAKVDYKGQRFIQTNANYYGYRDGNCIDFHVSHAFPANTKIDYINIQNFSKTFGYFK